MGRPSRLGRWYTLLKGRKLFFSAPGQRNSNGGQLGKSKLPTIEFLKRGSFTFNLYALDAINLGMCFRLMQWGLTDTGQCNYIKMCYLSSYESPTRAAQIEQRDLVASKVIPDPQSSDDRRQEALLSSHQMLYAARDRELWFHHTSKQTITLKALSGTLVALDSWRGPKRSYAILRAFLDEVELQVLVSGFSEERARELAEGLVHVSTNASLAEWHDREHRVYMELQLRRTFQRE